VLFTGKQKQFYEWFLLFRRKFVDIKKIFSAIFLLVLMSVFTGKCNAASDFWGYSFGLGWTSTCFSIVFAVASFILKMQEK